MFKPLSLVLCAAVVGAGLALALLPNRSRVSPAPYSTATAPTLADKSGNGDHGPAGAGGFEHKSNDSRGDLARDSDRRAASGEDLARQLQGFRKQRELERLLAAGYSSERADWLERRSAHFKELRRQQLETLKEKGQLAEHVNAVVSYAFDPDLDLRGEIGDDEYAKYRHALGRAPGVRINSVMPSTGLEGAGLLPGDTIVSYEGTRVFNIGELSERSRLSAGKAPSTIQMEVRRNGQTVLLMVPKGQLKLDTPLTPPLQQ